MFSTDRGFTDIIDEEEGVGWCLREEVRAADGREKLVWRPSLFGNTVEVN